MQFQLIPLQDMVDNMVTFDEVDDEAFDYNFLWMSYGSMTLLSNIGDIVVYWFFYTFLTICTLIGNKLYMNKFPRKK